MTSFDLTESIRGIQRRLIAQLRERRQLPHPTHKGDEGELLWLNVLSEHLPRRYAIRRGMVIDSKGQRSDAIDLIVYDPQYTPVFLAQDEHAYVLAEAVYAVFEVKYALNAENIRYAGDKAASVRKLHRTSAPIVHAGGKIAQPKAPFTQLAGLLTIDHKWSDLEPNLRKNVALCSGQRELDFVLCLESGFLETDASAGASEFGPGDMSFVAFLYALLHRLQQLATAPAVDWGAYRKQLAAMQAKASSTGSS